MKRKHGLFTCIMIFCLVWGIASTALAEYNLSFEVTDEHSNYVTAFNRGDDLIIHIVVSNPEGGIEVAGCAFTLEYPSDVLLAPVTDEDGVPTVSDTITSIFPFSYSGSVTHRENSSELGKILLAGATIDTDNGGPIAPLSDALFTIRFTVRNDAPIGNFQFDLEQTELFNPAAGYGTDDNGDDIYDEGTDTKDTVPLLVGAVDSADPNWGDLSLAFPVLLGDVAHPFSTVTSDACEVLPPPTYTLSGNINYTGYQTGNIYVGVFNSATFDAGSLIAQTVINGPGSYSISGIPQGTGYYIVVFRDSDTGGEFDIDVLEAQSIIDSFDISADLDNYDIMITDGGNHFNRPKLTPTNMDMFGDIFDASDTVIADGDEVAAFVDDGQGGMLLVGSGLYGENTTGSYGLLHIYGDDSTTAGVKDGANTGDTVILKTFDKNAGVEYDLMLLSGDNIWAEGTEKESDWKYQTKQMIPLHRGWNLISFGVNKCFYVGNQPTVEMIAGIEYEEVSSISDILTSIDGEYSYVRGFDITGAKSYNLTPFSDMKYMAAGYGYWIKVNDDADVDENGLIYLELEGSRVAGNKDIPLHENWNLVGYLGNKVFYKNAEPTVHFPDDKVMTHLDSDDIADIFTSINGQYSYVRGFDETGAKSYNLTPFSDMKYTGPGYGYWIKVNVGETPDLIWDN